MLFQSFVLSLLPALAAADFNLWFGTCDTGFGDGTGTFDSNSAATDGQGSCGGCTLGVDGSGFSAGNPCNGDCGADPLDFVQNGDNYDIIVKNTGINVGHCEPADIVNGACNNWNYACSTTRDYRCITSYCN